MSLLGRNTPVPAHYAPEILDPVPRAAGRAALGLGEGAALPFCGEDLWHAWELGWLDSEGRPRVGVARLRVPCSSPQLVESKSLKLYLHSLNGSRFASRDELALTLARDLSRVAQAQVGVEALDCDDPSLMPVPVPGLCIDEAPFRPAPAPDCSVLKAAVGAGDQVLYTHLLRSLCPVTGQPDWATLVVRCEGVHLEPAGLLSYVSGFREHREFHEQCVERCFVDIRRAIEPAELTVQAFYTRRGGLDINPWRSSRPGQAPLARALRQ